MVMGKGRLERRDRLHRVCKHVIAGGPRNVDDDIKTQFKAAVLKYAATEYLPTEQAVKNIYQSESELGSLVREAFGVIDVASDTRKQFRDDQEVSFLTGAVYPRSRVPPDATDDDRHDGEDEENARERDDDDGDGEIEKADHHVSRLANLLVESGRFTDRGHALRHLTSHPDGVALVRTHKAAKDEPMDRIEGLTNAMKGGGLEKFCKALVANNSDGVSEHDLTAAATRYAKSLYPDLTAPAAFAKLYEADQSLREATAVAKSWPMPMSLEPMVATGASGFPSTRMRSGSSPGRGDDSGDVDAVGVSDAYEQLVKLAEQQRRNGESSSQAFERVYLDPANKHLAEAERSANRPQPTTYFPMPR